MVTELFFTSLMDNKCLYSSILNTTLHFVNMQFHENYFR
jgi:hypothetical protein